MAVLLMAATILGVGLLVFWMEPNYPFEVVTAGASPSAVLADQVKSVDWRKRRAKHKGKISAAELAEVRA